MLDDKVTILIPTSPIPRHPDTSLIEECVSRVRNYFPSAKIIIMADGVRSQVEHRREQYTEYKERLSKLWSENKFGNTEIRVFAEPSQQAIMAANTLNHYVSTPLIMFVEHDAIFRKDPPIAFSAIFNLLLTDQANLVRFYGWQDIWHEHEYLMRGEINFQSSRFVKTVQYSQWPLVSRSDYHRKILKQYFKPGEQSMIEPKVYYDVANKSWEANKLVIYLDGGLTFTHRDGRTDETTGQRDPAEW